MRTHVPQKPRKMARFLSWVILAGFLFLAVRTGSEGRGVVVETPCFPAIFGFGSSVADTGADVITRGDSAADSLPYGMTFFNRSSKRYSDGRLIIDFWAQALGLPLLAPALKVVGSNFYHGANFAIAGSTAMNSTYCGVTKLFLSAQLHQFREFKRAVVQEYQQEDKVTYTAHLPPPSAFDDALYIIAAGGNDLSHWFSDNVPFDEMSLRIPEISAAIMHVVQGLFQEGARNILVEDVYPMGCLAGHLTVFVPKYGDIALPSSSGCSEFFNKVVKMHNAHLRRQVEELARNTPDLSIAFVDLYSIRYEMMTNPRAYGFEEGVLACCGYGGGQYNFDASRLCGEGAVEACANVSAHVGWDGQHFTEAANGVAFRELVSRGGGAGYFHPSFRIPCSLVSDI